LSLPRSILLYNKQMISSASGVHSFLFTRAFNVKA
jgi:hypothetical protein